MSAGTTPSGGTPSSTPSLGGRLLRVAWMYDTVCCRVATYCDALMSGIAVLLPRRLGQQLVEGVPHDSGVAPVAGWRLRSLLQVDHEGVGGQLIDPRAEEGPGRVQPDGVHRERHRRRRCDGHVEGGQ